MQQKDLQELYEISLRVLYAVDDFFKADLDKRNLQRPWRLLCLNHCIIATRTGQGELARRSYDLLVKHLPEEAESFFDLGMKRANAGQFSFHCKSVLEAYHKMYRSNHLQPSTRMNASLN